MSTTEAPTTIVWDGAARIRRLAATIALGETAGVLVPVVVIALMARISVEAMYVRSLTCRWRCSSPPSRWAST
ncbi:hypothetical protein V2I01_12025 [Micromonospora sp. BRA006-A]|nr:hypothetical protein [Micromonospora sp. BRA006-A]